MKKLQLQCNHTFGPVYDEHSKILILGTFPSVKSREAGFYYYHPQNRFWKVLAALYREECPESIEKKKEFLLRNHIAVWDVIERCDIEGSSDSSIKNVVPADIGGLVNKTAIQDIYANGAKAYELYQRYCYHSVNREIIKLPSTSPANAAYSLERLVKEWEQIKRKG